jgi:hypothetical protein
MHPTFPSFRRQPPSASSHRFITLPLSVRGFLCPFAKVWASSLASRLANTPGRIAFVTYGPMVHLRLLSTSPRGDAVTFDYGPESVCPVGTSTPQVEYTFRRTSPAFQCRVSATPSNDLPSPYQGEGLGVRVKLCRIPYNPREVSLWPSPS